MYHGRTFVFLAGKPLIAWTIEEAKRSKYIDRIIISSEDEEIILVAKKYGCDVPFVRPKELSEDNTPGIDPVLHAINVLPKYDLVVLLQATSPMRTDEDIDQCIEQLVHADVPACVSVTQPDKSPYWMYTIESDRVIKPLINQNELVTRRQDLPSVYALNGAVYVAYSKWLQHKRSFISEETVAYVMPKKRSYDIDTEEDFLFCEYLIMKEIHP